MLSFNNSFTETECTYSTSTGLKSTLLSSLAYSQLYSRRHNFGTFSSLHSKTLYPLAVNLHFFQTLLPKIPQQPLSFFLTLWIFLLWTVHINGIKQYRVFCRRPASLSTASSGFIHSSSNRCQNFFPFLRLNNTPLYVQTTLFFIHPSADTWVVAMF